MPHYIFPKGVPRKETAPLTETKQEGPRSSAHKGDPQGPERERDLTGKAAQQFSGRAKKEASSPGPAQGLVHFPSGSLPCHCAVSFQGPPHSPNKIKFDPLSLRAHRASMIPQDQQQIIESGPQEEAGSAPRRPWDMASSRTVLHCQALPSVRPCAMGFMTLSLIGFMWFPATDMNSDFPEPCS